MPYSITKECIQCDDCRPRCPSGAIKSEEGKYWIDPTLCNGCEDLDSAPLCVQSCPVKSPTLVQAKKGRARVENRPYPNPDLFLTGKSHPFASAMVMWELCNILAQRDALPWQVDEQGRQVYRRDVQGGQGNLTFRLAAEGERAHPTSLDANADGPGDVGEDAGKDVGEDAIAAFDLRATALNLIFAAYAVGLETPWETPFIITDQQIESYLGLDKRRDLRKLEKLTLIKELVEQPCRVLATICWPRQGAVDPFCLESDLLWHLLETQYHFQEDDLGCKHLVGLTFTIQPGEWTRYFLNKQTYHHHSAFYQYGYLPKSLLTEIMGKWQQHEGAVRMMVWLLFKTRLGEDQRITVRTLLRVAYGEERILQASIQAGGHKRLMRTFESDLEALNNYGLKPIFDPVTYPMEIQPLWAKLADLPDDAEAALEFWTRDGGQERRLTDTAPRGKWQRLLNARLLYFELPADWTRKTKKSAAPSKTKQKRRSRVRTTNHPTAPLSGPTIAAARKRQHLSQRALANQIGKSQSWIRDVENGRFQPNVQDQNLLRQILHLDMSERIGGHG